MKNYLALILLFFMINSCCNCPKNNSDIVENDSSVDSTNVDDSEKILCRDCNSIGSVEKEVPCGTCHGDKYSDGGQYCYTCNDGYTTEWQTCEHCHGKGTL